MGSEDKPTCFIAMPIATREHEVERYDGDAEHWIHVMETIHVPAVEAAGFRAIRPVASGSHMIHGEIIKHLSFSDMVLCDLSSHNPNVFFELGVRTSLNKPVALVRDEHTSLPFDTSGLNTHEYASTLRGWETGSEVSDLTAHIRASAESCRGANPLWRHFGLTITADKPDPEITSSDAQLQLMYEAITEMRGELAQARKRDVGAMNPFAAPRVGVRELADRLMTSAPVLLKHISVGANGAHTMRFSKTPVFDNDKAVKWERLIAFEVETEGYVVLDYSDQPDSLVITVVPL